MDKSKLTELLRYAWLEGRANGLQNNGKSFSEFLELKEVNEAINYSQYCKSDREQLRDKKIKDLVNIANSELSNYNKQKILKTETEESRNRNKLLKKIVDLQNP